MAWAGRSRDALALAEQGLAANPSDDRLLFARTVALRDGYEYGLALADVERLSRLRGEAKDVGVLQRTVEILERPYVQFDLSGRHESDGITVLASEVSFTQPISEAWWMMTGGSAAHLTARSGSAFGPIGGGSFMAEGGGWIGAQTRLAYGAIASARLGEATSGKGGPRTTWQASLDNRSSDDFRLQLVNLRDFQIVSPRSLSLGITRIDTIAQVTYTPDLSWTVVGIGQEAELSDHNRLLRASLAPRHAVFQT